MASLSSLGLEILADRASRASMLELARDLRVAAFATNPTLTRRAGAAGDRL